MTAATTHQCPRCLRWFPTQADRNSHTTALTKPCERYDLDALRYWAMRGGLADASR